MKKIFWDFKNSFIGLPFIPQIFLGLGKATLAFPVPIIALHYILSDVNFTYYDLRDSDIENI